MNFKLRPLKNLEIKYPFKLLCDLMCHSLRAFIIIAKRQPFRLHAAERRTNPNKIMLENMY
jgi:hypothetical protein